MRYLIEFVSFAVALPLLLRYIKAQPGKFDGPPPRIFRSWSRGGRLALAWISIIVTVAIVIPDCLTGAFLFVDTDICIDVTAANWACQSPIRYVVAIALFVPIFAGALKWSVLLGRVQNYKTDQLGE